MPVNLMNTSVSSSDALASSLGSTDGGVLLLIIFCSVVLGICLSVSFSGRIKRIIEILGTSLMYATYGSITCVLVLVVYMFGKSASSSGLLTKEVIGTVLIAYVILCIIGYVAKKILDKVIENMGLEDFVQQEQQSTSLEQKTK
jgi:uncharacterized membrane protein YvlD (DUF360 family)